MTTMTLHTDAETEQHIRELLHTLLPDPLAGIITQGPGFNALVANLVKANSSRDEFGAHLAATVEALSAGQVSWMTHRAEAPAAFLAARVSEMEPPQPTTGDTEAGDMPPQLTAMGIAVQAFCGTLGKVDLPALEIEAEELDREDLAGLLAGLDNARADLADLLNRFAPAVRNHQPRLTLSEVGLSEATERIRIAGDYLREVCEDLDPRDNETA